MFSLTLLVSVFVLLLTWLIIYYYNRNKNLPPGPWGFPILGYYPFLSEKHYLDYAKLAKRYGNVFSYRTVGGKLVVVLNGILAIKEVLLNRADEFIGRPQEINLVPYISDGLGIAQEEGLSWKEHRRFFLQTAKTFGFGKQESEDLIHQEAKELIDNLKSEDGKPCNLKFYIGYAVSRVITPILFSKKFDKDSAKDVVDGAVALVEQFADQRYMLVGPIYEYIVMKLFPSARRLNKAKALYKKIIKKIIDDHVKTFDPNNLRDYVDGYLSQASKLNESQEEHTFTMKRLHSISFNMLMEGTESVGGTIYELLQVASNYPEEQKLVQEELDSVVGQERLPSWIDRHKLPYLEAFIQELYRHNMPFNISTHYCNFKETTLRGYRIPKRTIVIANQWTVNNDHALYPEPSKFDPKRFVDKNGKKIKTEGPHPFGIGKRSCIGESLAQMEVLIFIAAILQNFTLYSTDKVGYTRVIPRQKPVAAQTT